MSYVWLYLSFFHFTLELHNFSSHFTAYRNDGRFVFVLMMLSKVYCCLASRPKVRCSLGRRPVANGHAASCCPPLYLLGLAYCRLRSPSVHKTTNFQYKTTLMGPGIYVGFISVIVPERLLKHKKQ